MTLQIDDLDRQARVAPGWRDVRVRRQEHEADGVLSLTLFSDEDLPDWEPGAHIDIELSPGIVRQYSLCGHSDRSDEWTVAVRLDENSRGGSAAVHREIRVGDALRVSSPRNRFALEDAPGYLFLAGGIGITPLLPMIRAVDARGLPWQLHYAGRSTPSMAFRESLNALDRGRGRVHLWVSELGDRLDIAEAVSTHDDSGLVYCCGPHGMLADVASRVSPSILRTEAFGAIAPAPETHEATTGFEIELVSDGTLLEVPDDRSVLDVLEDAGVEVSWSCREGTCGSCETAVIGGTIDHRDNILTDAEREAGDCFFPCVSRAKSPRLTLDL